MKMVNTARERRSGRQARPLAVLAVAIALAGWQPADTLRAGGGPPRFPFAPGEECVYRASGGPLGRVGTGTMRVSGPEVVDGRAAMVLSFDLRGRLGPAVVEDRTRSWVDPLSLSSLRFTKRERSPLANRVQDVEMDTRRGRWESADGREGALSTAAPLDELSFIYYIRTLPLGEGAVYSLDRHFEAGRNPVVVRVVGRGRTRVPAGEFATVEVEMRVKDPARYRGGEGTVRLFLTDDERRVPVRIESGLPLVGRAVLSLESHSSGAAGH